MPVSTREERRQQRKLERQAAQQRAARRSAFRKTAVLGVVGLALAVVVIVIVVLSRRPTAAPANLPGTHFADPVTAAGQLYQHVPDTQPVNYDHYPPNHGNHYDTPRPPGMYDSQVPEGYFVHDLEHGAVVILYHCPTACPDTVSQLRSLLTSLPKDPQFGQVKLVISPYDKTEHLITLVAWDYQQDLDSFDAGAIRAFYQAHVDKGPERAPI